MFLVEIEATIGVGRRPGDDEVSDLIATLVDELDRHNAEPSVGTRRRGNELDVTVGVVIDAENELRALAIASALVQESLDAAGVHSARDVRPRVVHQPV